MGGPTSSYATTGIAIRIITPTEALHRDKIANHRRENKYKNLRVYDNWCGIRVLSALSKIIAKLILERIKEPLISTIDAEQAGLRASSSCTDHINSVRIIIEQCKVFRSKLHIVFIDFEKAFNSVHRDCNWEALRSRGIPDKIITIIKATDNDSKYRMLHKDKLSEPFEVHSRVR